MKTGITPKVNVQTNVTPDLSQGNFNQAFAAARSAGLTSFTWNGKLYGTQLAPTRPAPKKQNFHNLILDQEIFLEQKKLECLQLKELDLQIWMKN